MHNVSFKRTIDQDATHFERMALDTVLDEIQENTTAGFMDIRNGHVSSECLESDRNRLDVLFRTGDWISVAMQITGEVYDYAGSIKANGAQVEVLDLAPGKKFRDLKLEDRQFTFDPRQQRYVELGQQ